jgi:NADPH:quinone reductase-like Zn-dependent oxidoreductase
VRAAFVREPGAFPEVVDRDEPEGELLEVVAAPINPSDLLAAAGGIPDTEQYFPFVPGYEAVGRTPDGRFVWVHGEEIGFGGRYGAMAERVPLDGARVYDLPDDIDAGLAAALGIAGLAGWLPLAWRAPVEAGDTVLVLGATGTAGIVAVQAAKLLGAGRVVAAGRNERALERAAELGADATVRLDGREDLAAAFRDACGNGGPTYVFDPLWGEPLAAAIEAAAPGARVVCLGRSAGPILTIPSRPVVGRALTVFGHSMYEVPETDFATHHARLVAHAIAGEIVVDVERVPLEDIADAWRRKADGAPQKLVVTP